MASPTNNSNALSAALGAYLIWGVVGLYFRHITVHHGVAPFTLLAHRIVWSLAFVSGVLLIRRDLGAIVEAMKSKRLLGGLAISSVLVAINWIIFIYASANEQLVQASVGYFLTPLVNVLLGVTLLRERLTRGQQAAIALAVAGVSVIVYLNAHDVVIPIGIALSFSFYAFMRKRIAVGPIVGLGVETALLLIPALIYLAVAHGVWHESIKSNSYPLLIAAGVITAIPLILFSYAARRLRLITLGLLQYVGPTLQFILAWLWAGETVTRYQLAAFGLIWLGLIVFTCDGVVAFRRSRAIEPT